MTLGKSVFAKTTVLDLQSFARNIGKLTLLRSCRLLKLVWFAVRESEIEITVLSESEFAAAFSGRRPQ
jgi:hypothetical protein